MKTLKRLITEETGATVFEYAFISCMITMVALTAVVALGMKFLHLAHA